MFSLYYLQIIPQMLNKSVEFYLRSEQTKGCVMHVDTPTGYKLLISSTDRPVLCAITSIGTPDSFKQHHRSRSAA